MSDVHRYKVVKMLSEAGNQISYDPHGPDAVMASAYDQIKAENELLRHQLAACAKEMRTASDWICKEVEVPTKSATHWAVRLKTNADQVDEVLGKGEQS